MFYNMYVHAAPNYAPGFMKADILNDAYMTDFIKFVEDDGEYIPAGVPESNSGADIVKEYLSNGKISMQTKGLKEEFDLLGIKPKVIVTVSSKLNRVRIRRAIEDELGYKVHFEQLYHYTPRYDSYKNGGYESYEEMYATQIKEISKNTETKI